MSARRPETNQAGAAGPNAGESVDNAARRKREVTRFETVLGPATEQIELALENVERLIVRVVPVRWRARARRTRGKIGGRVAASRRFEKQAVAKIGSQRLTTLRGLLAELGTALAE